MPNAIYNFFVTAYGGKLYVIGGHCGEKREVLEVYDPIADSWSYGHISQKKMFNFIKGCHFSHKYVH